MQITALRLPYRLFLILGLAFAGGCGSDDGGGGSSTVPATFQVRPGVEQVTVTGAPPRATLIINDGDRDLLGLITDDLGQATFAYVPSEFLIFDNSVTGIPISSGSTLKAGTYTIRNESTAPMEQSEPFDVLGRDDLPPVSLYESQVVGEGFGYIEVRDGLTLSVNVRFPAEAMWGPPPWPTLIEYSGYGPSNPESEEPGSAITRQLGFATVGVNMRGTGCSGGVFDVFNPAQQADGYDVVETIARQPWVLHGKPGMVGLSYSGISQLFVASTRPPHLAAITPLSVIEDPWRQQWPGGVYNSGFTRQWLAERDNQSGSGVGWVRRRIADGDTICEANQAIRTQNVEFEALGRALEMYPPDEDARRLSYLVRDIEVPVYLTGAWQDEQTGSLFANMLDDFTPGNTRKFILFNGRHPDGYSPAVITRWWEFLNFYVARRIPRLDPLLRQLVPIAFAEAFGVQGLGFEPDRFPDLTEYEEALAAYESEARVRVLFEVGAGHRVPGAPVRRFETSFDAWPPPGAEPRTWFLGAAGALTAEPPSGESVDRYQHDAAAGDVTYYSGSANDFLRPLINFTWPPLVDGYGLSYISEPLAEDVVVAGNGGYVNLWFASEVTDANVEVTLTEVRPDGVEYIVQSGVLRVAHRKINDELSDTFLADYTFAAEDFEPLTPGEFIETKVPFRPFAHAFRAGSRLRLIIDTPGRDSPLWAYENPNYGRDVFHSVKHGPEAVSFLLLPVVDGVEVPESPPACPSLRGQVCRPYVAPGSGG
jgi:predicted acyl esterase